MEINAAKVTIDIGFEIDESDPDAGPTPTFGVDVKVLDPNLSFIGTDPDLLPNWLEAIAADMRAQLGGYNGPVPPMPVPPMVVHDEEQSQEDKDKAAEMERLIAEKKARDEAEAIASITASITEGTA